MNSRDLIVAGFLANADNQFAAAHVAEINQQKLEDMLHLRAAGIHPGSGDAIDYQTALTRALCLDEDPFALAKHLPVLNRMPPAELENLHMRARHELTLIRQQRSGY